MQCPTAHSNEIRVLCELSLPEFDERVLLDDTMKLLCYGDCSKEEVNAPHFASYRTGIVTSGWIETVDKKFEEKKPNGYLEG